MSVSIQLLGQLIATDSSTGTVPFRKQINLTMLGTAFEETQGLVIGTTPVTITLPITPTQVVYIGNLHPTNTITVTWTPNGGTSAVVQTIGPVTQQANPQPATQGILLINNNAIGTTGITALSIVASAAFTPIELMLGG
jgi:hypothetical protein